MAIESQSEPLVNGDINQGVVVLTLRYSRAQLVAPGADNRLGRDLVDCYNEMLLTHPEASSSCVVNVVTNVAGSPVVRALFDLYKTVAARSGDVIVANYPDDFIDSLTSLGLTDFPGFSLSPSVRDAVGQLRLT